MKEEFQWLTCIKLGLRIQISCLVCCLAAESSFRHFQLEMSPYIAATLGDTQ
jgi:hypothetical protein